MHSLMLKFFRPMAAKSSLPAVTSSTSLSMRSHYGNFSQEEERIYPVYVHHVSKIVLQHLQESRADWVIENGLDKGLHVKSNGTFLLNFPARQGYDAGKIWTSYDASTRQHWLSVYRPKFNARYLLKKGKCSIPAHAQMFYGTHKIVFTANESVEAGIRAAVDQMIQQISSAKKKI